MGLTDREIKSALAFAVQQVQRNLAEFTYDFKNAYSEHGFYRPIANTHWTNGFWTGQIWLAYEWCTDIAEKEKLKQAGDIHIGSFLNRIEKKTEVDHHDMGFLYSPSCVAGYQLTQNPKGRKAAIMAADQLTSRFHEKGGFIQAWGSMEQPENYRFIIDCLLNVPLLYWADRETGEEKYRCIAQTHIYTTMSNVIRADYSTWHTFYMDRETGLSHHGATCQGYRDASAWARGQAWAVYGTALAYKYTGNQEYLGLFRHVSEYFFNHLPKDMIPYWDLEFGEGSAEPRDSSSASIVACGLLEMAKYSPQADAGYYTEMAKKLMKSLIDNYAVKNPETSNGLVLHSTYAKKSPYNTCTPEGVDECNIWGDYFYMEALTRLTKDWNPYW